MSVEDDIQGSRSPILVDFRFYDARHTFVTRLAENPMISEETIRQLAGHVSHRMHRMLARYAHIRSEARRNAIATLETRDAASNSDFGTESPQSPLQLRKISDRALN
jgi:integrase